MVAPVQASGRKVTGNLRMLDSKRERRAHLIAVERTVTRGILPARAKALFQASADSGSARL